MRKGGLLRSSNVAGIRQAVRGGTRMVVLALLCAVALLSFGRPLTHRAVAVIDSDGDGLPDATEIAIGTDPFCADSEDTLAPGSDALCNGNGGDGLTDFTEIVTSGTDPLCGDSEDTRAPGNDGLCNGNGGDGLTDGAEVVTWGTDPLCADSEDSFALGSDGLCNGNSGDGLTDYAEVVTWSTDPLCPDSEDTRAAGTDGLCNGNGGDAMFDSYEVAHSCLNPLVHDAAADPDSDGLSNTTELAEGTDPCDSDTDSDGLTDSAELAGIASPKSALGTFITDPLNADTDDDACPDAAELGADERQGGRRDPTNHWDYFNPTQDGKNRVDDILAVVQRFGKDAGDPAYDTRYDRTSIGPNFWNLGPPDGKIRVPDILASIRQFGHDCV